MTVYSDDSILGSDKKRAELSIVQKTSEDQMNLYPLSPQGWENLNNTIQVGFTII